VQDPIREKQSGLEVSGSYQAPPAVFGGRKRGAAGVERDLLKKPVRLCDSDNGDKGTRRGTKGGMSVKTCNLVT
jgi:hypothetical protein